MLRPYRDHLPVRGLVVGIVRAGMDLSALSLGPITLSFVLGCTNNLGSSGGAVTAVVGTGSGGIASSTTVFTLTSVILDPLNPSTTLDLIGDSSGSIGNTCQSVNGTIGCSCSFSYTTPAGSPEQISAPVTYVETNQARCSYSSIPTGVINLNVTLVVTVSSATSNSVVVNLTSANSALNLALPTSYASVINYQCRDDITVYYPFDASGSKVYDPVQSTLSHLIFPLNYYSASLGQSISTYVNEETTKATYAFNCHPNLTPLTTLTGPLATPGTPQNNYIMNHGLNPYIYSSSPASGGCCTSQIAPPSPCELDRSSFVVVPQATGIFTVPINMFSAPGVVSTLGYGASPIAGSETGTESCPTTQSIPPGYQWVKLWVFSASLSSRVYYASGGSGLSLLCNSGDWSQNSNAVPIYPSCPNDFVTVSSSASPTPNGAYTSTNIPPSLSLQDINSAYTNSTITTAITAAKLNPTPNPTATSGALPFFVDRIAYFPTGTTSGVCVRINTNTAQSATASAACSSLGSLNGVVTSSLPGPACTTPNFMGDLWQILNPEPLAIGSTYFICGSGATDPFSICKATATGTSSSTSLNLKSASPIVPLNQFTQQTITENPRIDYIFVVTPTTVNSGQMIGSTQGDTGVGAYLPIRYAVASDCPSGNPSEASCKANQINYRLLTGTGDPNGFGASPICALQITPPSSCAAGVCPTLVNGTCPAIGI